MWRVEIAVVALAGAATGAVTAMANSSTIGWLKDWGTVGIVCGVILLMIHAYSKFQGDRETSQERAEDRRIEREDQIREIARERYEVLEERYGNRLNCLDDRLNNIDRKLGHLDELLSGVDFNPPDDVD